MHNSSNIETSLMSISPESLDDTGIKTVDQETLPIGTIVRAVCRAASAGPDLLYEVMLKLSLMVEATAPTYGLSTWAMAVGQQPRLKWAEGLDEKELAEAEARIVRA